MLPLNFVDHGALLLLVHGITSVERFLLQVRKAVSTDKGKRAVRDSFELCIPVLALLKW